MPLVTIRAGERDELVSSSSRLMVGQPFIGETWIFSLRHKLLISCNSVDNDCVSVWS